MPTFKTPQNPKIVAAKSQRNIDLEKCTPEHRALIEQIASQQASDAAAKGSSAQHYTEADLWEDIVVGKLRIARIWLFVTGGFMKNNLHGRMGLQIVASTTDGRGFSKLAPADIVTLAKASRKRGSAALKDITEDGPFQRRRIDGKSRHRFQFNAPLEPPLLNRRCRKTGNILPEPPRHVRHLIDISRKNVSRVFFEVARTAHLPTGLSWNATMVLLALAARNGTDKPWLTSVADIQAYVPRSDSDVREALKDLESRQLIHRIATYNGIWRDADKIVVDRSAVRDLRRNIYLAASRKDQPAENVPEPNEIGPPNLYPNDISGGHIFGGHKERTSPGTGSGSTGSLATRTTAAMGHHSAASTNSAVGHGSGITAPPQSSVIAEPAARCGAEVRSPNCALRHQGRGICGEPGSGYEISGRTGWSTVPVSVLGYQPTASVASATCIEASEGPAAGASLPASQQAAPCISDKEEPAPGIAPHADTTSRQAQKPSDGSSARIGTSLPASTKAYRGAGIGQHHPADPEQASHEQGSTAA